MLRLTLVRHAKTQPAHPGQEDWDRVLEQRGQRDAPEMARRLKERKLKPNLILASPAVRAITTANLMARILGVGGSKILQDERLYLASPRAILDVIHELGATVRHLMLIGHNPGISEFGDEISGQRQLDHMPTCAVYTLQFDIAHWRELIRASGVDAQFDYPKNFSPP